MNSEALLKNYYYFSSLRICYLETKMVSTRPRRLHEKPWKPHRFWVNLSGRRANWIGFSYLSSTTSILCTTNIPSSLHLSPITDSSTHTHSDTAYIKRNVTWTNKYSWVRASTKKLAELVQIHFWRIRVYVETWSQWLKLTQKSLIFFVRNERVIFDKKIPNLSQKGVKNRPFLGRSRTFRISAIRSRLTNEGKL